MTPWTIDTTALSNAGVTTTQAGDVVTFTWGPASDPLSASAHVVSGQANFFPERSGKHVALMTLLGLLNP